MSKQALKRARRRLGLEVSREPLPAYAWPGGYPLVYWCVDGEPLCAACVNAEIGLVDVARRDRDRQWDVVGMDVHWEGEPLVCAHCGEEVESAYGESDADDEHVCDDDCRSNGCGSWRR